VLIVCATFQSLVSVHTSALPTSWARASLQSATRRGWERRDITGKDGCGDCKGRCQRVDGSLSAAIALPFGYCILFTLMDLLAVRRCAYTLCYEFS